jgi:heme A synthase
VCDRVRLTAILCVGLTTITAVIGLVVLTLNGKPDSAALGQLAAAGLGALAGLLAGQRNGNGTGPPPAAK